MSGGIGCQYEIDYQFQQKVRMVLNFEGVLPGERELNLEITYKNWIFEIPVGSFTIEIRSMNDKLPTRILFS